MRRALELIVGIPLIVGVMVILPFAIMGPVGP